MNIFLLFVLVLVFFSYSEVKIVLKNTNLKWGFELRKNILSQKWKKILWLCFSSRETRLFETWAHLSYSFEQKVLEWASSYLKLTSLQRWETDPYYTGMIQNSTNFLGLIIFKFALWNFKDCRVSMSESIYISTCCGFWIWVCMS